MLRIIKLPITTGVLFAFLINCCSPWSLAQADMLLPKPGSMVSLSAAYEPAMIKGITVYKNNPLRFDFIIDPGQEQLQGKALTVEGEKLIKYFMASLAIPEKDLWVNLSPYEKDRTIPEALGKTGMGRDLLAQDYVLKQITASLIYPENGLGKKFWDLVYKKSQELYGHSVDIPVNTFNKVWITADTADVFARNQSAFVVKSHLKVMLEEDYVALNQNNKSAKGLPKKSNAITSQIIRDLILPELEREVNEGKNFANLRQVFNSLILATWYKRNLKDALLNQVYADESRVKGIDLNDPSIKDKIYQRYLQAYKKGVFNFIKEPDPLKGEVKPRKYFSGGVVGAVSIHFVSRAMLVNSLPVDRAMYVMDTNFDEFDRASTSPNGKQDLLYDDSKEVLSNYGRKVPLLEVRNLWRITHLLYSEKGIEKLQLKFEAGERQGQVMKNDSYAAGRPNYIYVLEPIHGDGEVIYAGDTDIRKTFENHVYIDRLKKDKQDELKRMKQKMMDLDRFFVLYQGESAHFLSAKKSALVLTLNKEGYGDHTYPLIDELYEEFSTFWTENITSTFSMDDFFLAWNSFTHGKEKFGSVIEGPSDRELIKSMLEALDNHLGGGNIFNWDANDIIRLKRFIELYYMVKQRETLIRSGNGDDLQSRSGTEDALRLIATDLVNDLRSRKGPVEIRASNALVLESKLHDAPQKNQQFIVKALDGELHSADAVVLAHVFKPASSSHFIKETLEKVLAILKEPDVDIVKAPILYLSLSQQISLRNTDFEKILFQLGFTVIRHAEDMQLVPDGQESSDRPLFRYAAYARTHPSSVAVDDHIRMSATEGAVHHVDSILSVTGEVDWNMLRSNHITHEKEVGSLKPRIRSDVYRKGEGNTRELENVMDIVQWFMDRTKPIPPFLKNGDFWLDLSKAQDIIHRWDNDQFPYLDYDEHRLMMDLMTRHLSVALIQAAFPRSTSGRRNVIYGTLDLDARFNDGLYAYLSATAAANTLKGIYQYFANTFEKNNDVVRKTLTEAVANLMDTVEIIPSMASLFKANTITNKRVQDSIRYKFLQVMVSKKDKDVLEEFIADAVVVTFVSKIELEVRGMQEIDQRPTWKHMADKLISYPYFKAWHASRREEFVDETPEQSLREWSRLNWNLVDHGLVEEIKPDGVEQDGRKDDAGKEEIKLIWTETKVEIDGIVDEIRKNNEMAYTENVGARLVETSAAFRENLDGRNPSAALLELIREYNHGITDYQILTKFHIYVPSHELKEETSLSIQGKRKDLRTKEQYMSLEGALTSLIWFYERLSDEELKELGFESDLIKNTRMQVADMRYRDIKTGLLTDKQINFLLLMKYDTFSFDKLPEGLRTQLKNLHNKKQGDLHEIMDINNLPKEDQEMMREPIRGLLDMVTIQDCIRELLKQKNLEAFKMRPERSRRLALLSFLSQERMNLLTKRQFDVARAKKTGRRSPDYLRLDTSELYGWGTKLFPILYEPTFEQYEVVFNNLGIGFPEKGDLQRWLETEHIGHNFLNISKEWEYVLSVTVNVFKEKFPSIVPNNDDVAVEFAKKYNVFRQWAIGKGIDLGQGLDKENLGKLLVEWIKEQEPGISNDEIFVRFGILVVDETLRNWERLWPKDSKKVLTRKQINMDYPGFEGQLTAAIWFFRQLSNQELEDLGIRKDLVLKYRKQLAEIEYLDLNKASYFGQEQVKLISTLMEIRFDFVKFPEHLRSKMIYYTQMNTAGAKETYGKIFSIPEGNLDRDYQKKVLRDITMFSVFGDMVKQMNIDPQGAIEVFAIRPQIKRLSVILGYLWTIRGIFEDSMKAARGGKSVGVTIDSVSVFFATELFGNGFLFDIVKTPSWEEYARVLTALGVPETVAALKERFLGEEASNPGITQRLMGIKDQAMMTGHEGGINLNTANMSIHVQDQGKALEMAVDPAMIERIKQEGVEGFIPHIVSISLINNIVSLIDHM